MIRYTRFLNNVFSLFLFGLIIRIVYTVFFAHFFTQYSFQAPSILYDKADFGAWLDAFKSLIHTGSFTTNPDHPYGYFTRMPGYSMFIGFFYLIFGQQYYLYALVCVQVLLDSLNIILIFKITQKIFPNSRFAFLPALLYCIHPINILWSPILMSECLSVFLMILSWYYLIASDHKWRYSIAGLIMGVNILVRPQIAVLALIIGIVLFIRYLFLKRPSLLFKQLFCFSFFVSITYGVWPARNYFLHDKLIFTHEIRAMHCWADDVYGFMCYITSVQTNWDPQFSQIVGHQKFEIDKKIAYATPTDSADLAKAIYLSQTCGSGFSNWPGYGSAPITGKNCDTLIYELFAKLKDNQMKYNAYHYWVTLPLQNLRKCFFKSDTSRPGGTLISTFAPLVFILRTLLNIAGLLGCLMLVIRNHEYRYFFIICLCYFISWYGLICFGSGSYMRNIEMRYLIQPDTLMIFSCMAYTLSWKSSTLKQPD